MKPSRASRGPVSSPHLRPGAFLLTLIIVSLSQALDTLHLHLQPPVPHSLT